MVRIALDAGHGMNTPGKRTPAGEREWAFNDIVIRWVIHNLKSYEGVEVLRLDDPTGRRDVPLKERTDKANAWKADSLVSIHHNAFLGKWGNHTGTETFIFPDSAQGMKLAQAVHPELVKRFKLKDRGIKEQSFHMLRESNMPAILTEGGYMDSNIDIVALRSEDRLRAQADGITAGLVKYHKLKKQSAPAPEQNQPKVEGVSMDKYAGISKGILEDYKKAVAFGITNGDRPNDKTSRAETAVMIYKGLKAAGLIK